nr:DeoR/GlpR family DNA-binding transcription regulator [uncultured Caproiciproducens sp.]
MSAAERLDIIKQLVANDKKVYVSQLSTKFNMTEETIRRDLEKLEAEGILTRTYGGAILNKESSFDVVHFYKRASINMEQKQMIAVKAVELLKNKSTISADSSSTVMETLKLIKNWSNVTLLTNSTEALSELNQSELRVISTGGVLNKSSLSLQGVVAKKTIENYNVDILLMSCKGLDMQKGALDSNESEAELKKLMVHQATEVALLVDHTKFDRSAFVQLVDLNHINYIVTDQCPDEKWIQFFQENQIKIIY